jgi:phosphoenolpyruvate phosphomutase-like protein
MPEPSIAELLASSAPLALPGVFDALSALMAARAGFRAIFVSGYSLSATRLGQPDFGLLTQTEVLDAAARVVAVAGTPVIVDVDTGYGNVFNVERTIAELVRIGAAGLPRGPGCGRSAVATWTRRAADQMLPFDEMNELLGLSERYRREREWLR